MTLLTMLPKTIANAAPLTSDQGFCWVSHTVAFHWPQDGNVPTMCLATLNFKTHVPRESRRISLKLPKRIASRFVQLCVERYTGLSDSNVKLKDATSDDTTSFSKSIH